jgi:hypothetical protein
LYLETFLPGKLTFCSRVLKWHIVPKAADKIGIPPPKFFGVKKINELVSTGNELTNKFAGVVTNGLRAVGCQLDHGALYISSPIKYFLSCGYFLEVHTVDAAS